MPRLIRNSRETTASNDTGRASSSGRETTPTASSSSHVSAVPSSSVESVNAANVVNDVVQALQGTLAGLVQSAIDARLPVLPTSSVENNLCRSSVARTANLAGNAVPVESHLETQTNRYLNVSSGYAGMVSGASSSDARGRLVPSFVNTFATPSMSLVWSGNSSSSPFLALASAPSGGLPSTSYPSATIGPLLPHSIGPLPFIVGPGYAPISAKTVGAVVAGKYINLADLLPAENSYAFDESNEPQLLLDGRLVLTGTVKKPRKEITDIVSWVEAFAIYSLIVCTSSPHRWRDLATYKLLILRTYRQFQGYAWLAYDKAFRQHAAATNLGDWSELNIQLFNFHTAGSASKVSSAATAPRSDPVTEGKSNSASPIVCASWNRGRCVAPTAFCRFRHACSACSADHRVIECPSTPRKGPTSPIPTKSRRF